MVGPTLRQIERVYGDKVRIVWKHLPLDAELRRLNLPVPAGAPAG